MQRLEALLEQVSDSLLELLALNERMERLNEDLRAIFAGAAGQGWPSLRPDDLPLAGEVLLPPMARTPSPAFGALERSLASPMSWSRTDVVQAPTLLSAAAWPAAAKTGKRACPGRKSMVIGL